MGQLVDSLSKFWNRIQGTLFPFLEEELEPLTEKQKQLVSILELIRIEEFIPQVGPRQEGRPLSDRASIARAFVAKAVYNLDSTRTLLERLETDKNLRRICGWESDCFIPSESTFSRAFAEFANSRLATQVHDTLIKVTLSEEIISHNSRDSTAIDGWEKPRPIEKIKDEQKESKKKRGRPKKGEKRSPPEPSLLQKQSEMTLEEMQKALPKGCDVGGKKNSKGFATFWVGYKLHLDVVDGCIPVSAILTSASVHDSQVAIPLATMTEGKITNLYDLMDAAYDVEEIRKHSESLGHVLLIDRNPRRNEEAKLQKEAEAKARKTLNWKPAEARRYNERTTAERSNSRLKLEFGAEKVKVRGHAKVFSHLMFGVLALAADQFLKLVQ